ncbi:hypothetical protein MMC31_006387, partial [Peltigera leucophlebia]|nr:hypothetical protein [Peltigera leucophlebia]
TLQLPILYIYIPPDMANITYAILHSLGHKLRWLLPTEGFKQCTTEIFVGESAPETLRGKRVEFSPAGIRKAVEARAILVIQKEDNHDRVVFHLGPDNTVTFMGLVSHEGDVHRGYHGREFVVSEFDF